MADVKKITVQIQAVVGDAMNKLNSFASATKQSASSATELGSATSAASVAVGAFTGQLAAEAVTAFAAAIGALVNQIIDLGAEAQKSMATLGAMKNLTTDATEAWQYFNDVGRNTNYDLGAVQEMGVQLVNMGYSAKNAADLIQLCADTSAGLGQGQAGAQQLVETLSRIQSTGEMSSRQLIALQMNGMDLDKAFSSVGMTAEQAMKAMDDGTLDAQRAVQALTEYMHEFDGSMEKSKNNVSDQWGDVKGNIETACAEIGASIFDAFNQSEIIQTLIGFTQDLVDLVRSDGSGAFSDFREVAEICLDAVNTGLKIVITAIKSVILAAQKMYAAFKSIGSKIASALEPILAPLSAIWNLVKSLLTSLGQKVAAVVDTAWTATNWTSKGNSDDWDLADGGNHFRRVQKEAKTDKTSAKKSGGGSKTAKAAISEEERAIEALIKKYSDADKARHTRAKEAIDLAKANISMLRGEAKIQEEKRIKIEALTEAHNVMSEGYQKELDLAAKIADENTRSNIINEIKAQAAAEEKLYQAKVKVANFEASLKESGKENKSILDRVFGTQDEHERKIREIQDGVARVFETAAYAKASNTEGDYSTEDMDLIAKMLHMTPAALQEELDMKNETLTQFVERNKEIMAEGAKALIDNENAARNWSDVTIRYATMVGDAMSNAMMDWITGAKSGKEALSDFVSSILKTAAQLLTRWLSLFAIFSIVGDPALAARNASAAVFGAYDGKVSLWGTKKAHGGYISGSGTSTSDNIPAMLSNGEYVIQASAVRRLGVPMLNALNSGQYRFADGGYVGGKKMEPSGAVNNLTLQVNTLDASDFDSFLNLRGGGDSIQRALIEAERRFAFTMGG